MILGNDVKVLRLQIGLNQEDFGVLVGMTQKNISTIENGKKPLINVHQRLFAAVGLLFERGLLEDFKAAAGLLETD